MNVKPSEHPRLAALFLSERRDAISDSVAMGRALATITAERRGSAAEPLTALIATVEHVVDVDLQDSDRWPVGDPRRAIAYWLICRRDVSDTELATALCRDTSAITRMRGKFRKRLVACAELRERVAGLSAELERRLVGAGERRGTA